MTGGETTTAATTTDSAAAEMTTKAADTTATPKWYEKYPEGLRGEKTLHNYADETAAVQALVEAKKWQSGAIKIPGKDAKPEEIAAFREKLGVPKTAADYDLAFLGQEMALDPGQKDAVMGQFHKLGLSQEQVAGLLPWAYAREQQQLVQLNDGYLAEMDKRADEWGEAVFSRRVNQTQALLRRYGSPELMAWLNKTKNTNNPLLLDLLHPIAAQFAEDGYIASDVGGNAPSVGEIDTQITAAREAMTKMDNGSPEYKRALAAYEDLIKLKVELEGVKK